jgi:hypothetical protein
MSSKYRFYKFNSDNQRDDYNNYDEPDYHVPINKSYNYVDQQRPNKTVNLTNKPIANLLKDARREYIESLKQ